MKTSMAWLVMCGLVCAIGAQGAIIVQDTFDGTQDAWLQQDQLGSPGSSWADSGSLGGQIHQSHTGDGGAGAHETVYTTDTDFQGDWTAMGSMGAQQIVMDFYSDSGSGDGSPDLLQLYFQDGSGQNWYYTVNASQGWGTYAAPIEYGSWSSDGPDTYADWLSSLQTVSQVGIYLAYEPGVNDQSYGIDDFSLDDAVNTPEPGTFLFLGVAFASMGMSFRKKLRETLASMLKK